MGWIREEGDALEEVVFPEGAVTGDPGAREDEEDEEGVVRPANVAHARTVG